MTWWMYAVFASVIWGIHYNLLSKSMTAISPITAYWLPTVIMILGMPLFYKTLVEDYHRVIAAPTQVKISVILISFTSFLASWLLYKAIHGSNATYASLIEISFPIFVALFAYLIFQENHLNPSVLVGGLLILAGTGLVIYNS